MLSSLDLKQNDESTLNFLCKFALLYGVERMCEILAQSFVFIVFLGEGFKRMPGININYLMVSGTQHSPPPSYPGRGNG